ncbi:metal-dependent protein hydrolase [Calocera viscosa TUFC12733]|uniref:Metal-dependent protein hydrolase n=1 Tax=Calocera viscosa (strain TUFC12733) TaxID=1330018 RepID=A0A167MNR9_CALVF|nr:metal-dependent protein hydrolase [Calocera viscosa TUFC12733]
MSTFATGPAGGAKTIGTHNGTFHADEALAVYLLRQLPEYKNSQLVRSRDPAKLDACDIVVDVGAIYDPAKNRFDHHQRGFTEIFGHGFVTKLSSAGLVYKHFGKELIAQRIGKPVHDPTVELLWLKLYKEFIESIDANDNGINQYPTDVEARYRLNTGLSSRVGHLNPAWNQPSSADVYDSQFAKASALTGTEFFGRLDYYANAWLPARDVVKRAMESRTAVEPTGRILLLETFAPWKEHLFELEEETGIPEAEKALYVLYPDETGGNWRVQAVSATPSSFESRKALPEPWRGVRDDDLSTLTGIPGCIFVHASGFIGGNKSKEGAMEMAKRALEF